MQRRKKQQKQQDISNGPLQPLLTIADVCKLLQLSRPTIYTLIDQGLPYMKFGKAVRFSPASLEHWLARREEIA